MVIAILLLLLFLLAISAIIFFLFCFFIPKLIEKYTGTLGVMSTEKNIVIEEDGFSDVIFDPYMQAVIIRPSDEQAVNRLTFQGVKSCAVFHATYGSQALNSQTCIGYGDCIKACPQKAIFMENGQAVVSNLCSGCGKCVDACPISIISLAPAISVEKPPKKHFKFWYTCYRILARRIQRY
ncbi:MAG: 4Fe-4S dicluster domain-containing protein [Treponema sp.]|nr:4Fe-4S dicluster domain-containing protein [Treponema sp.]